MKSTSNVSWPKSWKFQLLWAFSPVFSGKTPQQAGVARHFWTQSSYNGLASRHRQKIFKRWGSQPVTWKMSTFPKSFYFISAEGKNVKNFLGNIYKTSWYAKKTITKMLVFEISHHIIQHLSKSTTQPKFSAYLHLSPQWCRTSILTPHRHSLFATFLRSLEKSCAWLVILQVISFSWCYFLLDGSWAE